MMGPLASLSNAPFRQSEGNNSSLGKIVIHPWRLGVIEAARAPSSSGLLHRKTERATRDLTSSAEAPLR